MGKITVVAGDFTGEGRYDDGRITLRPKQQPTPAHRMKVVDFFASIEIAAQRDVVRIGGAVGWGAAGAILAGPVGLLAGAVLGGRGKQVLFVAVLKDGRRFVGRTDSKTYAALRSNLA